MTYFLLFVKVAAFYAGVWLGVGYLFWNEELGWGWGCWFCFCGGGWGFSAEEGDGEMKNREEWGGGDERMRKCRND